MILKIHICEVIIHLCLDNSKSSSNLDFSLKAQNHSFKHSDYNWSSGGLVKVLPCGNAFHTTHHLQNNALAPWYSLSRRSFLTWPSPSGLTSCHSLHVCKYLVPGTTLLFSSLHLLCPALLIHHVRLNSCIISPESLPQTPRLG